MTILVDDRTGSAKIYGHLRHWGVPAELTRLEYGDAAFAGNGPKGPVTVGIEMKKVHDALSCMGDGRFAGHQLPGLLANYDRVWLVVEGTYRPDFGTGLLLAGGDKRREVVKGNRRYMYRDFDNWLTSMEVGAGIRIRRTCDGFETARCVADLYGWWQKEWTDHRALHAIHEGDWGAISPLVRPSLLRRFCAILPGVGLEKSANAARVFGSIESAVRATQVQWEAVPGIGRVLAERIYNAIRGR